MVIKVVRPIPMPDGLTQPFWDAVNEQRLIIQNCSACSRRQYPPEPTCANCGSAAHLEWIPTSGRGKIASYTVMHDSRSKVLQKVQPFNIAAIALEEDPDIKFFSNLLGTPVDEVPMGATVQVEFVEVAAGRLLPEWRVVS